MMIRLFKYLKMTYYTCKIPNDDDMIFYSRQEKRFVSVKKTKYVDKFNFMGI